MPREKQYERDDLITMAMHCFWKNGFEASSMANLVEATHVNRHGIYAEFGNKKELFLACLEKYQHLVVTPAFKQVEQTESNLDSVLEYLKFQIRRADEGGLPGYGCLVANTMTECGPHDPDIEKLVHRHNQRLTDGFANAIKNEYDRAPAQQVRRLAFFFLVSVQGLWSVSRTVSQPKILRQYANTLVELVRTELDT